MLNIKINGRDYQVEKNTTILEACHKFGIQVPTLCFLKDINEIGACRMCLCEVKGARSLVAACVYPIEKDGTEIFTNTPKIRKYRKTNLELLLSSHDKKCLSCPRNTTCELQKLCIEYGVYEKHFLGGEDIIHKEDHSTLHLVRNDNKCILCRRCVAACKEQYVGVIGANNRGFHTEIGCAFNQDLGDVPCVSCGQCTVVCPTGALVERDDTDKVFEAIADPTKHVVVHTAPSIRATLGECFDMPIGTNVKGKMVTALKMLGFDKVFDTNFGADLTIMEEGTEFIERVTKGGTLPMITSCSPGWIKFCEHYYPDLIPHLSTCKSPQQMQGAMIKSYYAEKAGIDPKDIVVVSVMPCIAKKFEIQRDDQGHDGMQDNDISISTRELAKIDVLTGEDLKQIDYTEVRGTDDIKEATYEIAGKEVKVAVTSGLKNAAKLLDEIRAGKSPYQFIEIMCCPGGCVNGGGQPIQPGHVRNFTDLKALRAKALYEDDLSLEYRKSHDNPEIKAIYDEYLEKPGSHRAHELLHTSYVKRGK